MNNDIDMVIEYVFGALPPEVVKQIEERASTDTELHALISIVSAFLPAEHSEQINNGAVVATSNDKLLTTNEAVSADRPLQPARRLGDRNRSGGLREWLKQTYYRTVFNLKVGALLSNLGRCATPDGRTNSIAELDRLVEWASSVHFEHHLAKRLVRLGAELSQQGRIHAIVVTQEAAVRLCRQFAGGNKESRELLANALFILGNAEHLLANLDIACLKFDEAIKLREELFGQNTREFASVAYCFGLAEEERQHLDRAQALFLAARSYYETEKNTNVYDARCLAGLARIEMARSHYDSAAELLDAALNHARRFRDSTALAEILNSLGILHFSRQRYEAALEVFTESTALFEHQRGANSAVVAVGLLNRGTTHGLARGLRALG